MLVSLIVAAVLAAQGIAVAAPPAAAQGPPAAPAADAKPAKPPKPKLVCVEQTELGSLMPRKICATPEQWEKRRQRDTDAMSQMSGNASPR